MKNTILLLLLLVSISMQAKYFSGTLTFADGKTKSGLVSTPNADNSVDYKENEDAAEEKIEGKLLTAIDILHPDGSKDVYVNLYTEKAKKKVLRPKSWFKSMHRGGKVNFLAAEKTDAVGIDAPKVEYYFQNSANDYATPFFANNSDGTPATQDADTYKKQIKLNLKKACPILYKNSEAGAIVIKDMTELIEAYKTTCG